MTIAREAPATETPEVIFPKGEFYSDEPPVETHLHLQQIILLLTCLQWYWREKQDYFATGNLTIYYSPNQKKSEFFRGPDFFVVLNTDPNPRRKSWVVWQEEGKYPDVIVEILSDSTAPTDREEKKQIYQDTFRTPDYFWFDPDSLEFQGFTLISGRYRAIEPDDRGWLWSDRLGLYLGIHDNKLRYFTPEGELVPTPEEAALQEKERAVEAEDRADRERQKAERLAARLRELGVDPEEDL